MERSNDQSPADFRLKVPNPAVMWSLLVPMARRLFLKIDKGKPVAAVQPHHPARFNWRYEHDNLELKRLYEAAKQSQWNASSLEWKTSVDPMNPATELVDPQLVPMNEIPSYRTLPAAEQAKQRHAFMAWMLSQFLHGEQGALFASCEITESIASYDAKLYGASQVADEGRHVEVFHRYVHEKLQKAYLIDDNLFTILDALVSDARWDMKFLGMQIMVEGLALGAFGVLRRTTREPLLRDMLRQVITDEARHVHYGVAVLQQHYVEIAERDRREREDWAYEVSVLLRNRFLAHEFYDEFYSHSLSRREWDRIIAQSGYMEAFRTQMFRRLVPNLKRINLLTPRIRPHYAKMGLLDYEAEKAAPELSARDILGDEGPSLAVVR